MTRRRTKVEKWIYCAKSGRKEWSWKGQSQGTYFEWDNESGYEIETDGDKETEKSAKGTRWSVYRRTVENYRLWARTVVIGQILITKRVAIRLFEAGARHLSTLRLSLPCRSLHKFTNALISHHLICSDENINQNFSEMVVRLDWYISRAEYMTSINACECNTFITQSFRLLQIWKIHWEIFWCSQHNWLLDQ